MNVEVISQILAFAQFATLWHSQKLASVGRGMGVNKLPGLLSGYISRKYALLYLLSMDLAFTTMSKVVYSFEWKLCKYAYHVHMKKVREWWFGLHTHYYKIWSSVSWDVHRRNSLHMIKDVSEIVDIVTLNIFWCLHWKAML